MIGDGINSFIVKSKMGDDGSLFIKYGIAIPIDVISMFMSKFRSLENNWRLIMISSKLLFAEKNRHNSRTITC